MAVEPRQRRLQCARVQPRSTSQWDFFKGHNITLCYGDSFPPSLRSHLPDHGGMRRAIPRWFTKEEFEELRSVFEYHSGAEVVSEIEKEYRFART
jgi:hypothetical protein